MNQQQAALVGWKNDDANSGMGGEKGEVWRHTAQRVSQQGKGARPSIVYVLWLRRRQRYQTAIRSRRGYMFWKWIETFYSSCILVIPLCRPTGARKVDSGNSKTEEKPSKWVRKYKPRCGIVLQQQNCSRCCIQLVFALTFLRQLGHCWFLKVSTGA